MFKLITSIAILGLVASIPIWNSEFSMTIDSPKILAEHFDNRLDYFCLTPGTDRGEYEKLINILTSPTDKTGCHQYTEDFLSKTKNSFGMLLLDSDNCSLATKVNYAEIAGAQAVFLKYEDDEIEDADIDDSSLDNVRIPVFLLRNTDGQYIHDVLNSTGEQSHLSLRLEHKSLIDYNSHSIEIFMSPQLLNNPMI